MISRDFEEETHDGVVSNVVADVVKMTSSVTFRVALLVGVVLMMFSASGGTSSRELIQIQNISVF